MEPLPPHPPTNTIPTTHVPVAANFPQSGYPDSNDSSPFSQQTDTWDESLAQVPGTKLRIMCSYGGHIIPRPHDRSLCYVGGETRMVVINRHSSLSSLSSRLSQSLLSGRHFTLKYQLPNEELDSLISVTTDEDLENMAEEYERILSTSPIKPARLRLFLFPVKPETAASMGSLLNDAKSETWFVDALNGTGLLPRGLSDSAVNGCLLELSDEAAQTGLEAQVDFQNCNNKPVKSLQELHTTMPDSPMMETGSSFGSSSSSPSMSNLPPIKVRVDDSVVKFQNKMAGLDEQFSQIGITSNAQNQDGPSVLLSAPPIMPTTIANSTPVLAISSDQHGNRIISDDDNPDHEVPTGFRKPPLPLPLQPGPRKLVDNYNMPSPDSKNVGGFNFLSPDSVSSDSSMGYPLSQSKHAGHQEPTQIPTSEYAAASVTVPVAKSPEPNSQVNVQQVHEHMYLAPPQQIQQQPQQQQQQQQQYVQPSIQYIHHHPATGQASMSSYYPMYAQTQQQQQLHHQIDQHHYPMYVLPVSQNQVRQPYNYPIQPNISDSTVTGSSRPPPGPSQNSTIANNPMYTTNRPEIGGNVYTTANHFQQQYAHVQTNTPAPGVSYGYEYAPPTNEQVYYTQQPVGQVLPQHQTMTAATTMMFAQASAQLPKENSGQ